MNTYYSKHEIRENSPNFGLKSLGDDCIETQVKKFCISVIK